MRNTKISFWRRFVKITSLILIIYGGYLFKENVFEKNKLPQGRALFPQLTAPKGSFNTNQLKKGSILWPSGATPVLENYPPGLVCRFNPEGGLFKACIVHFISENLAWLTPVKYLLPHIALFILLCFLIGRMWCGWVCPIGSIGDFLSWLRRKMNVKVQRFPKSFREVLRISSYSILGAAASISLFIGLPDFRKYQCYWFLPYCQICPARLLCPLFGFINPNWKDFSNIVSGVFTLLAWIILGLFVAAFYWGRRVWCHLCPIGLIDSWFNKGAGIELKKEALKCNKCGSCADACPMGLTKMYEMEKDGIYNQSGCIMCLRCVEICPREKCLSVNYFGKRVVESAWQRKI